VSLHYIWSSHLFTGNQEDVSICSMEGAQMTYRSDTRAPDTHVPVYHLSDLTKWRYSSTQ